MIGLLIAIAIIGLITWALVTFVPMPPAIQRVIVVIAVIFVIVYALSAIGLLNRSNDVPVPQVDLRKN